MKMKTKFVEGIKTVINGNFRALNVCIKEERSKVNNVNFHLNKLVKEE